MPRARRSLLLRDGLWRVEYLIDGLRQPGEGEIAPGSIVTGPETPHAAAFLYLRLLFGSKRDKLRIEVSDTLQTTVDLLDCGQLVRGERGECDRFESLPPCEAPMWQGIAQQAVLGHRREMLFQIGVRRGIQVIDRTPERFERGAIARDLRSQQTARAQID